MTLGTQSPKCAMTVSHVLKGIIDTYSAELNTILAGSNNYQPKDPFYAFRLMDKYISEGVQPVCIILGQDPYPQKGVPTGIAFANRADWVASQGGPSPSLAVIIHSLRRLYCEKEDKTLQDLDTRTFDVSLESWIKQGILPLNSALTVEPGKPGSHSLVWAKPMRDIIIRITKAYPDLCWIMLGSQATLYKSLIPSSSFVLFDNHPSWYARVNTAMPTRVWREAEGYCKVHFNKEIHWFN